MSKYSVHAGAKAHPAPSAASPTSAQIHWTVAAQSLSVCSLLGEEATGGAIWSRASRSSEWISSRLRKLSVAPRSRPVSNGSSMASRDVDGDDGPRRS